MSLRPFRSFTDLDEDHGGRVGHDLPMGMRIPLFERSERRCTHLLSRSLCFKFHSVPLKNGLGYRLPGGFALQEF